MTSNPTRTLSSRLRVAGTKLRHLSVGGALVLAINAGRAQAQTTKTYTADNSFFANPETGNMYWFFSTGTSTFLPAVSSISNTLRTQRQQNGVSTVCLTYYLGDYKYEAVPQSVLDRIDADMATLRGLGLKAIPYFHYAYEYDYENPQNWRESEKDATKDIIVQHCAQLKPIWTRNADVLALVAWGIIGP
ncbi:DUF4874 domain-containing protein [Hymenobacter sp. BT664]|uniref:DUF4874 domain-containing protein n=1 Tax=Hymenobacter montanus TaxID=2771359 RepID=A0A927BD04_9BACT|nr:DUF4874 domain-containing protein [Hymenobacter montanus]MBD2767849.1 DUF4874 domain-containing protein [Hymenobacter montanus]